jgi:hypothetical protein
MITADNKTSLISVGQLALYTMLNLKGPSPPVQSFIVAGARRTREVGTQTEEYYPSQYSTDGTVQGNLRFALKNEPLDLRIIHAALVQLGEPVLETWVRAEPTGGFSRRAWFLYETLTGRTLDLEAVRTGNYVNALDEKLHFVAKSRNSSRHRVRDNLLGTRDLCPVVRRTRRLEEKIQARLDKQAQTLTANYPPEILARAVNYLYTKETRSSFAIEGEPPSRNREERFLQALLAISSFHPTDKNALVGLQNSIVDPRYAATDWRGIQNYVGSTTRQFGQHVHFICPRPEDVPALMKGWMDLTERALTSPLDAVIAAAVIAFAFVFIHPFEDGNGRIHRFLIHHTLAKRGFSPPNVIFPVSAPILRDMSLYDQALNAFSKPIMSSIDWDLTEAQELIVRNNTHDLYRFLDATEQAEYLYDRVEEAIRVDLKEELGFLVAYDAAFRSVQNIVDMPDQRASLLIRLCLQNGGRLSNNRRKQFAELTDEEIMNIEDEIKQAVSSSNISFGE